MKNKEKKPKHYGKLLKKAIKEKGIKKRHVFITLKMSKPTLDSRLEDGLFTEFQKGIIEKNWLN